MATLFQEKQLGQARPADTNAVSIYSPGAGVTTIITEIVICNTSGSSKKFRIFLDIDGSTYDESTAHYWDEKIKRMFTKRKKTYWGMNQSAGNIAVRTDVASVLTFTVYGVEITEA